MPTSNPPGTRLASPKPSKLLLLATCRRLLSPCALAVDRFIGLLSVCVADRASCDAVAAALGIPSDQIGMALRAVVLAADVRGHGCLDWEALEVFHAGRCLHGGFNGDPEETYRREDGPWESPVRTWHGSREDHSLVRLRGFAAVDAFPDIARATTHDGFERSATFEHELDLHASPYRALKFAQEFAMALRPADFAGLIPLINAFRVKIKYKEPVYWRGDAGYFPLTTAGVLWREQARRKSRGWNNCGVFGPDGPDYL